MLGEEGAESLYHSFLQSVCCYHKLTTVLLRSVVLSLCWPTDSSALQGIAVAPAAPGSPMEVSNEPGAVFHWSGECFVPLCWGESGMKGAFLCYLAENRSANVKLNEWSEQGFRKESENEEGENKSTMMHGSWGLCGEMRLEKITFTGPEDLESHAWW